MNRLALIAAGCALSLLSGQGAWADDLVTGAAGAVSLKADAQSDAGKPKLSGVLSYRAAPAANVTTQVDLDARTGFAGDGLLWSSASADPVRAAGDLGMRVRVDWKAADTAALGFDASNRLTSRPVLTSGSADAASFDQRQDQTVSATAELKPAPKVSMTLVGRLRRFSDTLDLTTLGAVRSHLRTAENTASFGLAWAPTPQVKLEAGSRLSTTEAAWVEGASASQTYPAFSPTLGATLTPDGRETLTLGLSRVATPLDPAKFVALAQTSAEQAGDLRPDQEWRLAARWRLALPAAKLELGVEAAKLEASTELFRIAGHEAPGSVAGGVRSALDISLETPLTLLGLPGASLQAKGAWRRSRIADPLTGEERRRSGETPYETSLALVQTVPGFPVAWGLSAREQGAQSFYGVATLNSVETDPSLGAFIEYRPEPFVIRLQIDDIAGGVRRWSDATYTLGRDMGGLETIERREEGGPGFTLRFKRAL